MKKTICLVTVIILSVSVFSFAYAAGYTLPEKMQRQLVVGSGLKGSFVIHGNINAELHPLLYALNNAEFEIRGIQSEGNLHYYIYQPGENEARNALTELLRKDGMYYMRSDLLNAQCYLLPDADHVINAFLNSEGSNPSVFPDFMRILMSGAISNDDGINTGLLEKSIENWITGFSPETIIQSGDDGTPSLSQTFTIPVESMYSTVTELISILFQNDSAMTYLRSMLTDEQISLYFNPDLAYYYMDAMKCLDLQGNILFTRTVSTMGEPLFTSLTLPLDVSRTGYSTLTVQNNALRESILITGPKGIIWLETPADCSWKDQEFERDVRFLRIYAENSDRKNLSLQIHIEKKHDEFDDSEDNRTNETDHYSFRIIRNTSDLPVQISQEQIPEMDPVEAEIDIHYSSKLQLSSPTTFELNVSVIQGSYNFDLAGKVKTASPWEFSPFIIADPVDTGNYGKADFLSVMNDWIASAQTIITHTPEEIMLTDISDDAVEENP